MNHFEAIDQSVSIDVDKSSAVNKFLIENAKKYNFFQLVVLLQTLKNIDPDSEAWEKEYQIFFSANPSLGFAASDISRLCVNDQRFEIETTFLGLNGSQSPLPNFFLDVLATDDDNAERREFLDYFNNRVIAILFRTWRKYRYYICFKDNASDIFSNRLFSLIGLGINELRSESAINWCKMLAYTGMLAGRNRSTQVISGIVGHYFDLQASVTEWCIRHVKIPQKQKTCLGSKRSGVGQNISLGINTILGDTIPDCSSKFVLTLHSLTLRRFKEFLPSGVHHQTLKEVVTFVLRTQMAYDLTLELAPYEAPPLNLSRDNGGYLGWTSFVGESDTTKQVTIQIRH